MRVISGIFKSRKLKYDIKGTRPTMHKVKESIFAIIQNNIKNSICLDLFAGSGSLGIEAISNGASYVYFVDNNINAIKIIKDNIKSLNIEDNTSVILNDYKESLEHFKNNNIVFDLIFLDPPYDLKVIESILCIINEYKLLKNNGQVICEYEKDDLSNQYGNLICIKDKTYGNKNVRVYSNKM